MSTNENETNNCIFCAIVNGSAPAHIVHEDKLSLALRGVFTMQRTVAAK